QARAVAPVPGTRGRRVSRQDGAATGDTTIGSTRMRSRLPLEIEDDVVVRLRAADECAAVAGGFNRIRAVVDAAGDEFRLAGLADAGATGPADGHVAGFGEFQEAGVVVAPADR